VKYHSILSSLIYNSVFHAIISLKIYELNRVIAICQFFCHIFAPNIGEDTVWDDISVVRDKNNPLHFLKLTTRRSAINMVSTVISLREL
jgi:hypothetical protein